MGIKWLIKKSVDNEIVKSLGKDKLEALKAEVIAILKKKESQEDEKEFKKAIEYFEETELHYTHLEKSLEGEWIEKAGYGIGTVRTWKGKKYKKVSASPVRWVRVFDKNDRGAKSSMTRLINKVKSCKSTEELYQFCMSNHSLFQDDNGVDLPIMDKLKAAIDEQSGKLEGGKNENPDYPFKPKTEKERAERAAFEKDRIAAEKKAKDDAEREQYHGFMDGKTPAGKGKAKDILEKKGNFGGKIMTYQELADKYIADGGHVSMQTYQTNSGKDKNYYYVVDKDGSGYEIPKTIYDYAKYIKDNPVKKSLADIIMLDEYEHEDFDEDYSDFDASQPDLFNSPAYKVSAALDSIFGC